MSSLSDTRKATASWDKISQLMNQINVALSDLSQNSNDIFPKEVIDNIKSANTALAAYENKLKQVQRSAAFKQKQTEASTAFSAYKRADTSYAKKKDEVAAAQNKVAEAERVWKQDKSVEYAGKVKELQAVEEQIAKQNKALQEQDAILERLRNKKVTTSRNQLSANFTKDLEKYKEIDQTGDAIIESTKKQIEDAKILVQQREAAVAAAKKEYDLKKKSESKETKEAAKQKHLQTKESLDRAKINLANLQKELEKVDKQIKEARTKLPEMESQKQLFEQTVVNKKETETEKSSLVSHAAELQRGAEQAKKFEKAIDEAKTALNEKEKELQDSERVLQETTAAWQNLEKQVAAFEGANVYDEWNALVAIVKQITGIDLSYFARDAEKVKQALADYKANSAKEVPPIFRQIARTSDQATDALEKNRQVVRENNEAYEGLDRAEKSMEDLKNSVLQFFSVSNSIQIVKNAINDAIKSVKELDAAMTETAMVTDFSVSDMWGQLPKYTETANKLGTTVLGAYETMTLFYQQGLEAEAAFAIGEETMKMARIANLDYADATDKMTAALRGFNMELNNVSAARVNDVYSELAAITAADTEEIAAAMTKTASIAHSANMEFETTAAFLSQIIETTRESPETAGTAMKTIIARFQELKSPIPEAVDGEEVDANKIEHALRTVGVALRGADGQFRELDEVFLELSSKWNDLDTNTQRYIATIAAGSRQQSRFIAMMSDYDRTMELVEAATESAGASQEQFEKTTESLKSKLNRLSNAWAEYTMGLANNAVIKGAVDALTTLLNVLNDITGWAGNEGLGGIITGFNKLLVVVMSLKAGKSILRTFFSIFSLKKDEEELKTLEKMAKYWEIIKEKVVGLPEKLMKLKDAFINLGRGIGTAAGKIGRAINAFGVGKFLLILTAVAAAIAAIIIVVKKLRENSPERVLERARKAAEDVAEAANEAGKAFDGLKSSLDSLKESQKTLDGLVRGTKEWKAAVQEVNEQVLALIEEYPELAPFVESKGGVLTFNYEKRDFYGRTYDDVFEEKARSKAVTSAANLALSAQNTVYDSTEEFKKLRIQDTVYTDFTKDQYNPIYEADQAATEALAREVAKNPIYFSQEDIMNWLADSGYENSMVKPDIDIGLLRQYGQKLISNDELGQTLAQAIFSTLQSSVEMSDEEARFVGGFITPSRASKMHEEMAQKVEVNDTNRDTFAREMGWEKREDGKYYQKNDEGEWEQVEDLNDEQFKKAYAGLLFATSAEVLFEGLLEAYDLWGAQLSDGLNKALMAAFDGAGGISLTKEDIDLLQSFDLKTIYEAGGGAGNLGDYALFEQELQTILTSALSGINVSEETIGSFGLEELPSFMDQISAEALAGLTKGLRDIYDNAGEAGTTAISKMINRLVKDMSAEEIEEVVALLNSADWKSQEELLNLITTFQTLGIEVNGGQTAMGKLIQSIIDLAGASRTVDLETLQKQINNISKLSVELAQETDSTREFSKEEVEYVQQADPTAEFTKTGENSYLYTGDNYKELISMLNEYMQKLINESSSFGNATKQEQLDTYTTAMYPLSGQEMTAFPYKDDIQMKAAERVLDAKIAQEGLSAELEKTKEILEEQGHAIAESDLGLKALIIDSNSLKKATKALCETIEDNSEAFKEGNKRLSEGEEASSDYYQALASITEKAKSVFGGEITEEFVQANSESFENLSKGGEIGAAAFEKIQAAAREAALASVESDDRIWHLLEDVKIAVANADTEFKVTGYADISDIATKLYEAGMEITEVESLLESLLGASVSFKVGYQEITVPKAMYESNYKGREGVIADFTGSMVRVKIPETITTYGTAKENTYSGSGYKPSKSGGGGGGGSKESEKWENPYDKLYNLTREINEELRERERLERRYQQLLKEHHTGAQNIVAISEKELAHLQEEVELQQALIAGRKEQLEEYLADNSSLSKYAEIEINERGEQILRIDWEAISKVTDADKGQEIEDYIAQLEEWMDSLEEAQDSLQDIEDAVQEIKERGKDEYFNLEERIKEAVAQFYQSEIDNLTAINESINSTNERLVDAIQSSVDKMRQDRENAETEEEIADKQRQLVFLQQDTSGANDLAILQLQDEIKQAQQDYTDTLIDQKITELQDQNDKAAEQRQQQIELAQAQLDHYIESGEIWQEVYDLMGSGLNEETGLIRGSKLEEILKRSETFSGLSEIGQMEWLKELNANVASALAYLKVGRQLENLGFAEGAEITFTTSDGKTLKGKMDKSGNVTVDGKTYSDIYQGYDGNFYSEEKYENKKTSQKPTNAEPPKESSAASEQEEWKPSVGSFVKIQKDARFVSGEKVLEAVRAEGVINGKKGAFKILRDQGDGNFYIGKEWSRNGVTGLINKKYLTKYKTGGLADFTGPAWLDGTKSKPEMVLSARDTQNFIQLKDILSNVLSRTFGSSTTTENSGDYTYDIDINVEKIGSDYDLDRIASKVRSMITDASQYRNNNAIGLKR